MKRHRLRTKPQAVPLPGDYVVIILPLIPICQVTQLVDKKWPKIKQNYDSLFHNSIILAKYQFLHLVKFFTQLKIFWFCVAKTMGVGIINK